MRSLLPHRWWKRMIGLWLLATLAFVFHPLFSSQAAGLMSNPVVQAWAKARAAGSYAFESDITQLTIPIAKLTNVGRTSRSEQLFLQGQNDLHNQRMDLTLWSGEGNVQQPESGLSLRMEKGKSYARKGGGEWQEVDSLSEMFAPQGDFLSYLAALKEVTATPETRNDMTFTRYQFVIDSPRFARYIHHQLEAAMRAKGELPPGLNLEVPAHLSNMIGSGELWVGENGLPLRQILNLQFPEQRDEYVRAQITTDFSNFGTPATITAWQEWQAGNYANAWQAAAQGLPNSTPLFIFLPMAAAAFLLLRFRHVRMVHTALVIALIASQLVTPMLSTLTSVRFFDTQRAKAATQEELQADRRAQLEIQDALTSTEFNPHANPLEAALNAPVAAPSAAIVQAPAQLTVDSSLDSDGDTLSDFVEERIGTSNVISDTDNDGLLDNAEINGFNFGGQTWYLDPNVMDSNKDGQGDAIEWGLNPNGTFRTTPQDSDGDNLPDLFDPDNDNDGVPDNKDLAPFAKGTAAFTEAAPLQLTLKNLTANKPAFVEFQLRPENAQQLWYAFNVLDWPTDSLGQVQDIDGKSYAELAATQGRSPTPIEGQGDMKIVPMLEVRVPDGGANLPPPSALAPFNATVTNYTADGQTKVVYLPLNLVKDEHTGQRVAFSAKLPYLPTAPWNSAHQVRLVWLVQALVDQPTTKCDATANPPITTDCTDDGYQHNVPQTIQSYYTNWTLTGLTVREDHGATMLSIYEEPAVDNDKKNDEALSALSFVLDHHFGTGRSDRLTIDEVSKRFDYPTNNSYSAAQRFNVPDITRVVSRTYETLDQAVAFTAMTETVKILNDQFQSYVDVDRQIKPLILYAQENRTRMIGLDSLIAGDGYVTQNGANLTVDMAPSAQPAATIDTLTGLKWASYCPPATGPVSWQACTVEEYWDVMEQRFANLTPLPEDNGDTDLVGGRLMLAQFYYTGLAAGFYTTVQQGNQVFSGNYSLNTENETAGVVRDSLRGLSTIPLQAGLAFNRVIDPLFGKSGLANTFTGRFARWGSDLREGLKSAQAGTINNGKSVLQNIRFQKYGLARFYGGIAAGVATVFLVIFQLAALVPSVDITARRALGALAVIFSLGINVIQPIVQTTLGILGKAATLSSILNGTIKVANSVKMAGAVGLVISVALTWGFFIYAAATSGLAAGSPQLNKLAVEAIVNTVVAIYLFIASLNPIGLIIAGIVAFIDLLFTLICELGVDELRLQGSFYGGACFSLTTSVVKVASYFLYNYDLMVDLGRNDLVVTGAPNVTMADPNKGYVADNALSVSLPVTTTLVHKDPDPENGLYIYPYLWLFSPDSIRSGNFQYSLTQPQGATISVSRGQINSQWQNVEEDHKLVLTPVYRGILPTGIITMTPDYVPSAGLNQRVSFYFNMGYAAPAYECFMLPNPLAPPLFFPGVPICYTRDSTGNSSNKIDSLRFDIFPKTLDGFMALTAKADNGRGLAWDIAFPSLADADGDGLIASVHNGIDPNDALVDSDNDGLTDNFELTQQAAGLAFAAGLRDSDNDGLSDWQEANLGTDPATNDTDNDGLLDGEEVRHQVVDNNGNLTSNWAGGWQVRINAATPFNVWVSSDPFNADSDRDGISDQAERQLALTTCSAAEVTAGNCEGNPPRARDKENRPYHPQVANTPPLALFVETNDFDGFVGPNQSIRYSTTVVANTPVVPGVLNVTAPSVIGGAPNPAALTFAPLTFSGSQTVTVGNNFTVLGNAVTQEIVVSSTATTRLPNTSAAGWTWDAVSEEQLAPVTPNKLNATALAPARPDRQDSYLFAAQTTTGLAPADGLGHQFGDIQSFALPSGVSRQLDVDTDALNTAYTPAEINGAFLRGKSNPSVACNDAGRCMVVWEHLDYCNTLRINSLKVINEGTDGVAGVEPLIYLVRDPNDAEPRNGGFEDVWVPADNSYQNVRTNETRGPNANGFPVNLNFCGPIRLYMAELDGNETPSPDPSLTDWNGMDFLGNHLLSPIADFANHKVLDFIGGASYHIQLDVDVLLPLSGQQHSIAAAILNADGTIEKPQFQLSSNMINPALNHDFNPTVTSDGNNFLAAWENLELLVTPLSVPPFFVRNYTNSIGWQLLDDAGNVLSSPQVNIDNVNLNMSGFTGSVDSLFSSYADLTAVWANGNYLITRQMVPSQGVIVPTPNTISSRTIDSNGVYVAGSTTTQVSDASSDGLAEHHLAWNPVQGTGLLVYRGNNGTIKGKLFGNASTGPVEVAASGIRPQVAYHPASQSWLASYITNDRAQFRNFTPDLAGSLVSGNQPGFASRLTTNNLACPAPNSAAQLDLRFEELPGATTFVDSSGQSNNATFCSGAGCPQAGVLGAPNAPLSDYAVKFDGSDDRLTVNRAFAGSFSVMYWIKVNPGANNDAIVVDQGANVSNGWTAWLGNGRPGFLIGTAQNVSAPNAIDDGNWHFVAATRNQSTGAIALYIDGNPTPVASGTATTAALTAMNNLLIGGDRAGNRDLNATIDHLQIYSVALAGDALQAIYNRQQQSYCVGGGADLFNERIRWTRVGISQQDTRGGRISAGNSLNLTIDSNAPVANITSVQNGAVVGTDLVIAGTASDAASGVALVEVSVNNGAWLPAEGANTWSFSLAGYSGNISIRARAIDLVGNIGAASGAVSLTIDATAPQVTITAPTNTVVPSKNANNQWQVTISGGVTDNVANNIKANSVLVLLEQHSGVGAPQTQQVATVSGNSWSINYALDAALFDPTGSYSVTVQAEDNEGNRSNIANGVVRLDKIGPVATLSATDVVRQVISNTITISGPISDVNSIAGIDRLEIAFTPVEQIAALPADISTSEAEALLNRTWTPVTLAQRGAGVANSTWRFQVPTGLENLYQIDLRGYDLLGNVSLNANLWRGVIDTLNPRVVMNATYEGASYFNNASNQQLYQVQFVCAVVDRFLDESTFTCPGEGIEEPIRSFDNGGPLGAALQTLFPDLTIRNGLAISYSLWLSTTTPLATARVCDMVGRCGQASTAGGAAAGGAVVAAASVAAAAPGAPKAVIVNPGDESFVAANDSMSVTVAAEAGASLKQVVIKLDNVVVQTLDFAQAAAVTRTLRTVNVNVVNEGLHTLVAQATDWANATQSTLYPIRFTLDEQNPTLTIDPAALTLADTWVPASGMLRFNGNASDSVGLAAIQIREGNNVFIDAGFGGGTWQTALPVTDPEGRTLNITVRAIDRAGRITQLNQTIATNLSAADAPDTTITSGPANPSNVNTAQFVFSGSATAVAFECQIDNAPYAPCASPTSYSDLSKGSHTFRVRAIDSRGLPDLSPAAFTWTVTAGQPDATITGKPANPTTERTATFTFSGDATATRFECSLDGAAYSTCTSPKVYTNLGNGEHTFLVRARNSANVAGAADRYVWTVTNLAPVANSQTLVIIPNQSKAIMLTATDNEPLLYSIVTPPAHGALTDLAPNVTYSPDTGYGGPDSFTFKASDGLTESNIATVTLFVDNVPPVVTCSVTPNNLWPPNHKLVNIQATVTVRDVYSGPAGFTLVSVTSSEADRGLDAADVPNDIQNWVAGTPDVVGQVRSERSDLGPGRIYTLTYRGRDVAGNSALCTTTVTVPKSQGGRVTTNVQDLSNRDLFDEYTDGMEGNQNNNSIFLPLAAVDAAAASEAGTQAPVGSETVGSETVTLEIASPVTAMLPVTTTPVMTTTAPVTTTPVITTAITTTVPMTSTAAENQAVVRSLVYLPVAVK